MDLRVISLSSKIKFFRWLKYGYFNIEDGPLKQDICFDTFIQQILRSVLIILVPFLATMKVVELLANQYSYLVTILKTLNMSITSDSVGRNSML